MQRILTLLLVVFLIGCGPAALPLAATPTPGFDWSPYKAAMAPAALNDLSRLANLTVYTIEMKVDPTTRTLQGHATVAYTNAEDKPLGEIYFRLFPNTPSYGGKMTVNRVTLNGQPATTQWEAGDSALKILLPAPLAPGKAATLATDFAVEVPADNTAGYGLLTFKDDVLALANVYPLIPAYDEQGWHTEIAPALGDAVYSDAALYSITLTVPKAWVVVATGTTVETKENSDGTKTWRIVSGPMRDFYLALSDKYQVTSGKVGDTVVNSYYLDKHARGGEKVLQWGRDALHIYNRHFGLYPYAELDLVEVPLAGAGGVEFPGIAAIGTELYPGASPFFEFATVHEVAHQWWYGVVGDDQVSRPWLDEALAEYSSLLYYYAVRGESVGTLVKQQALEQPYQAAKERGLDGPSGLPVSAYTKDTYGLLVYAKGALFFDAVRQEVGDENFFAGLRRYYEEFKYRVVGPKDFITIQEKLSGKDLSGLYQQWVVGK